METKRSVGEIEKDLMTSALYQLSMTSKELFHSNFLYWVATTHPTIFNTLMSELTEGQMKLELPKGIVKREENNFDLCVRNEDGYQLILENKVKSVPLKDQLDEYVVKSGNKEGIFVLLTLAKEFSEKDDIKKKWTIVNYDELANGLEKATKDMAAGYHKELMTDYIYYIRGLSEMAESWCAHEEFVPKNKEDVRCADLLDKLRMSKMVGKLNGMISENMKMKTARCVIKDMKKDKWKLGENVFTDFGMTRGQGLIEAKIKVNDDYALGIQIQGKQYRRLIEGIGKSINFREMAEKLWWWFTDGKYNDFTEEKIHLRGECCEFGGGFKYQYRIIKDGATNDEVIKGMVEDLGMIMGHFEKGELR